MRKLQCKASEFIFPLFFFSDSGWGSRSRGKRLLPTSPHWGVPTFSQFLGRGLPAAAFLPSLALPSWLPRSTE